MTPKSNKNQLSPHDLLIKPVKLLLFLGHPVVKITGIYWKYNEIRSLSQVKTDVECMQLNALLSCMSWNSITLNYSKCENIWTEQSLNQTKQNNITNISDKLCYFVGFLDIVLFFLNRFNVFQTVAVVMLHCVLFFSCSIQFNAETFDELVLLWQLVLQFSIWIMPFSCFVIL